jgi:hypothetical protein
MRKLTLKIFEKHLALYGADLNRWHDFTAEELRDCIATTDDALDLYMDAQAVDRALDDFSVPEANTDVIAAALAQIKREDSAIDTQDKKAAPNRARALYGWGGVPRPAYAFALLLCVIVVMVFVIPPSQNKIGHVLHNAAIDGLIEDLERFDEDKAAQQDLLLAFAEVEDDIKIDRFIDHLGLDIYVPMSDDLWGYLDQQG